MSLNRLKRQDFHSRMCTAALLAGEIVIFYVTGEPLWEAILFLTLQLLFGMAAGAFCVGFRTWKELLARYLCAAAAAALMAGIVSGDMRTALELLGEAAVTGIVWLTAAKRWMRHELCPGWTVLVYDTQENLERAKAIAEKRKDLIADIAHFCNQDLPEEELDRMIRIFRIPQMVICLEKESEKMLDYCEKAGITAFAQADGVRRGIGIGRKFFCIRPQGAQSGLLVKK